ncbi:dynein regulatory complex protein 10-like [Pecten maximus]|nr:dynein regulatory complex protein 10-like [Pecten maximus]
MTERQNEYEEIDAEYTKEKKQLHELEERFKTLEDEYQQIMEERRVAREKREAAERDMSNMVKAATTIQAFWRSFKVRKALKGRKKKGGGGKKKK